jgi:hypothetical protein
MFLVPLSSFTSGGGGELLLARGSGVRDSHSVLGFLVVAGSISILVFFDTAGRDRADLFLVDVVAVVDAMIIIRMLLLVM